MKLTNRLDLLACCLTCAVTACGKGSGDGGQDYAGDTPSDQTNTEQDDSSDGTDDTDGGDVKYDTGPSGKKGCDKIDFLFVVDNSESMKDEQENLVASFPAFEAQIAEQVANDHQIMVVDTDAFWPGCGDSATCDDCCEYWCTNLANPECYSECNSIACPTGDCNTTLGAGRRDNAAGDDCGFATEARYVDTDQPMLADTFACMGDVGTNGNLEEKPMQAMLDAVTGLSAEGECNDGFLRDDAILVVTVISDEDDEGSLGGPQQWHQQLVDAKNGDEAAVVVLALVGDPDLPNPVCSMGMNGDGAYPAPELRAWASSFTHGTWASVCVPDYGPFFVDAVSVIDVACEEFEPEG